MTASPASERPAGPHAGAATSSRGALPRLAWRVFGSVSVAVGIVNAFLPLLPTTVFLLIGLWAWSKGAPEWHARLLAHPRYGPSLRHWRDGRRITRRGKRAAAGGMTLGYAVTTAVAGIGPVTLAVGAGLAGLGTWLWTRPEPVGDQGVGSRNAARIESTTGSSR